MLVHSLLLLIVLSCCCSADPPPTSIHLNSVYQPNQTERILNAGSSFSLSCHGNGSVHWSSTALRLQFTDTLSNPLQINDSLPKHTGTYHCGYSDQNQEHLATWVHLYIKDSHSMFVTPRKLFTVKEGQDFLFKCQLTDPSVKNLTLQLEDSTRGRILPEGMNVTFDRQRGALIRDVQRSFTGRYVCSGWKDGKQFISNSMELRVACRFCLPSLSVSLEEVIRLKGEKFEVTCMTRNPDHFYSITWTHPTLQTLDVSTTQPLLRKWVNINSTVTVSAVSMKHQGTYTCTAINGDGVARATTHLTVLDRPYLKIYLKPVQHVNANTRTSEADQFANVNISTESIDVSVNATDVNGASSANISGSSIVEAYKGQDVTLTFVIEAYPPVTKYDWMTHANISQVYEKHYISKGYRLEASLLLGRVHQEDRGQYSFHFSNSFFSGVQNVDLRIFRSPSAVVSLQNDTLTCSSSAYPPPTILWYSCPGVQDTCGDTSIYQVSSPDVTSEEEEEEVVSRYQPLSDSDGITIECVANNTLGGSRHVFQPREPQLFITPALIGALSTAAVLFLLLLVASYKWKQRPKYEIRWKIIESTDGNNYTFIDPSQLPYNQKWEFPRDKLRLGAVLGSGAFGKVVEATAYGLGTDNNVTRVAVKMLKPSAHSEERDALMSELKILSHLGYHDNIVNLLGACTQGGPMLMITEYCSHGDLLNFLRSHAQDFMTSILSVDEVVEEVFYKNMAAQNSRLRSDSGISCCSEYQEMLPVSSPGQIHQAVQMDSLSVGDLMRFSFQVAQGLDFLSNRNCIHRDVAARNVLLTDRRVAKICDFGLARDIRNDDSYIVQGNARLPVKWMAPESIFQCVYTVQSDVWSYGVLLWEIFSLGKSPYPNVAVDTNFYKMIKDGRHMAQPDFAPVEMYKLMTLCWSLEPTDRPTFKTIGQLINRLLPSAKDASPHHCHQAMYHNIDEFREEDEEEEVRGGAALKRGEEQTDIEEEEKEPMMKNIYQLS